MRHHERNGPANLMVFVAVAGQHGHDVVVNLPTPCGDFHWIKFAKSGARRFLCALVLDAGVCSLCHLKPFGILHLLSLTFRAHQEWVVPRAGVKQ